MAYQTVTPVASWPGKLEALADGDTITGAAMLALAQGYANALATLQDEALTTWISLSTSAPFGVLRDREHINGLGATNNYYTSLAITSPITWSGGAAHPGAITLTAAVPTVECGPTVAQTETVFLFGSKAYKSAAATGIAAGANLARITTPGDVTWTPAGGANGTVIAIGTDGGGACRIDVSTDLGLTWVASTSGEPNADTNWGGTGRLATDGASTIVAVPTATATGSTSIWYSKDAGLTWTEKSHGGGNLRFSGVGYDSQRGVFVMLDRDSGNTYSAADPAGTWAANTTNAVQFSGALSFTCIGGLWLLSINNNDALRWTRDAKATYRSIVAPFGAGTLDCTRLQRVDGRLAILGSSLSYLTGKFF